MFVKLFQLVSSLATAQSAIQGMQAKVQTAARRTAVMLIAGVVALVALGFFVAALWLWLAGLYGALIANVVVGGGLLVVVLILALIAASLGKQPPPPPAPAAADVTAQVSELLAEFEALVKEDAGSLKALAVAALIGVVVAKLLGR